MNRLRDELMCNDAVIDQIHHCALRDGPAFILIIQMNYAPHNHTFKLEKKTTTLF